LPPRRRRARAEAENQSAAGKITRFARFFHPIPLRSLFAAGPRSDMIKGADEEWLTRITVAQVLVAQN
jgi:hypothetical protein